MCILKRIKTYYVSYNKEYDIEDNIKFCDTLNSSLEEFNIFEKNKVQSK